jgi:hypothetical protein
LLCGNEHACWLFVEQPSDDSVNYFIERKSDRYND